VQGVGLRFKALKNWMLEKILKRKYITAIDYGNERDYGCKITGCRDRKGNIHIEKIEYF